MSEQLILTPLHIDESDLDGITYVHTINFNFIDQQGKPKSQLNKLLVFVPNHIKRDNDTNNASNNVLVFFTALPFIFTQDIIIHGLRNSCIKNNYVLIVVQGHEDLDIPDFQTIDTPTIKDCLKAAGLKENINKIRLASHSRGSRGMDRTLFGINDMRVKMGKDTKSKEPFVDVRKIEKLVYFDNFYEESQNIFEVLVQKGGIEKKALKVYRVAHVFPGGLGHGNQVFPDPVFLEKINSQFINLSPLGAEKIASIAFIRFILSALTLSRPEAKSGVNKFAANFFSDKKLVELFLNKLNLISFPVRGSFSSANPPLRKDQINYADFGNQLKLTRTEMGQLLLFYIKNKEALIKNIDFGSLDFILTAHHFFVCEFVHEIFE